MTTYGHIGPGWRVKVHVDRELHRWNCEECLQGESGVLGQRLIVIGLFLRHLDEPGWNQRGQETRCGQATAYRLPERWISFAAASRCSGASAPHTL